MAGAPVIARENESKFKMLGETNRVRVGDPGQELR